MADRRSWEARTALTHGVGSVALVTVHDPMTGRAGPWRATRSAGVTRPSARRRTWSTAPGSTGRWVISSTVRPATAPRRSRVSSSAVSSSRCSAGSSRITTGKSASSTRARASRWRWPPDSRAPCSPTGVRRPCGRESVQASSRARASASRSSPSVAPGFASRRLASKVESKTWASCSHSPTTVRRSSAANERRSIPFSVTPVPVPAALVPSSRGSGAAPGRGWSYLTRRARRWRPGTRPGRRSARRAGPARPASSRR